jgi:hypothetical protein
MRTYIVATFLVLGSCKCPANAPGQCHDKDGDGYGSGCTAGPDCDDGDKSVHDVCDCGKQPFAGGCACTGSATTSITCPYSGPSGTQDVGSCRKGQRACENGKWAMDCNGEVTPQPETCNAADDDCNGKIDEGLSNCGSTKPPGSYGPDGHDPFDPNPQNSDGVKKNPDGTITLDSSSQSLYYAWVANTGEGTVSKIDTHTNKEVARYVSALPANGTTNHSLPWDSKPCTYDATSNSNCPSRTALDAFGDVYVANRAFVHVGSVTKIATSACPDRNGDGKIETSSDVNGDGIIDINDPAEFLGPADECVLWTRDVGDPASPSIPRALAIDSGDPEHLGGFPWVGLFGQNAFVKIDPTDGHEVAKVDVPISPYGAAIDGSQHLWATAGPVANTGLTWLDTHASGPQTPPRISQTLCSAGGYGIAVDENGWVWTGGFDCGLFVFKPGSPPESGTWTQYDLGAQRGAGRGRGVAADGKGYLYVAWDATSTVSKLKTDGTPVWTTTVGGSGPIGVGLDFEGNVWAVNYGSSDATKLDPANGAVLARPRVGDSPYTYSDFTGYARRTFTAPRGIYRQDMNPCVGNKTIPQQLTWTADTPTNTRVDFFVRVADDLATLPGATAFGPFSQPGHGGKVTDSPADLAAAGVPQGKYVRVEVVMSSLDRVAKPTVRGFRLVYACGGPG